MRYVLLLSGLFLLAACADAPRTPHTSQAFVAPDDCLDRERGLRHRDWLQLCAELNED